MNDRPLREWSYLLLIHKIDSLCIRRVICWISGIDDANCTVILFHNPSSDTSFLIVKCILDNGVPNSGKKFVERERFWKLFLGFAAHCLIGLFIISQSFKNSVYILDDSTLLDFSFSNIFYQSVDCLLIFLTVSFT